VCFFFSFFIARSFLRESKLGKRRPPGSLLFLLLWLPPEYSRAFFFFLVGEKVYRSALLLPSSSLFIPLEEPSTPLHYPLLSRGALFLFFFLLLSFAAAKSLLSFFSLPHPIYPLFIIYKLLVLREIGTWWFLPPPYPPPPYLPLGFSPPLSLKPGNILIDRKKGARERPCGPFPFLFFPLSYNVPGHAFPPLFPRAGAGRHGVEITGGHSFSFSFA